MKAKLFFVCLALWSNCIISQDDKKPSPVSKGSILLNAGLSLSLNNQNRFDTGAFKNTNKINGLNYFLSINTGYFITNNFAVGIYGSAGFGQNTNKQQNLVNGTVVTNTVKSSNNSYSGGLFTRSYQKLRNEKIAGFLQTYLGYGWSTSAYDVSGSSTTMVQNISRTNLSSYSVGVNPGLTYFINHRVAVEGIILGSLSAQYSKVKSYQGGQEVSHEDFSSINFRLFPGSFSLGFNYYL